VKRSETYTVIDVFRIVRSEVWRYCKAHGTSYAFEDIFGDTLLRFVSRRSQLMTGKRSDLGLVRYVIRQGLTADVAKNCRGPTPIPPLPVDDTARVHHKAYDVQSVADDLDQIGTPISTALSGLLRNPEGYYRWAVRVDVLRRARKRRTKIKSVSVANHPTAQSIARYLGVRRYDIVRTARSLREEVRR
jgi:hypothetical protein